MDYLSLRVKTVMEDYKDFFGFIEAPFRRIADASLYYDSPTHRNALSSLHSFLNSADQFAVCIGASGGGKTTVVKKFLSELPENYPYVYMLMPYVGEKDLLFSILEALKVECSQKTSKQTQYEMLKSTIDKFKANEQTILIAIDEAQQLSIQELDELRNVAMTVDDSASTIKFILLGQQLLEENIKKNELKQLQQRVATIIHIQPLKVNDIASFVNFRIKKNSRLDIRVQSSVFKEVYRYSKGNPRKVSSIMERVLIAACIDGTFDIAPKYVYDAVDSLNEVYEKNKGFDLLSNKLTFATLSLAVVFIVVGLLYYYIPSENQEDIIIENTADANADNNGNSSNAVQPQATTSTSATAKSEAAAKADAVPNGTINTASVSVDANNDNIDLNATVDANVDSNTSESVATTDNRSVASTNLAHNVTESASQDAATQTQTAEQATGQAKEESKQYAVVTNSVLNMRAEPSTQSSRVAVLHGQQKLTILERNGANWYKVETDKGEVGWVLGVYISIQQ